MTSYLGGLPNNPPPGAYMAAAPGSIKPSPPPTEQSKGPTLVLIIMGLILLGLLVIACVGLGLAIGALVEAERDKGKIEEVTDMDIKFKGYPHYDHTSRISGLINFQCSKERIYYSLNYDVLSGYGVNGFFLWNHISDVKPIVNPLKIIKLCKANPSDTAGFPGVDTPICPSGDPDCVGSCKYSGTLAGFRAISKELCYDVFRNVLNYNLAINTTNVNYAALSALDKTLK